MKGSRKADVSSAGDSAPRKSISKKYVRCIEGNAPRVKPSAADAGPCVGAQDTKTEHPAVTPVLTTEQAPSSSVQNPIAEQAPAASGLTSRNVEIVCEVEVAGGHGNGAAVALSGGSISIDKDSLTLDLSLLPNQQPGGNVAQPNAYAFPQLPAPAYDPRFHQRPAYSLDPDFDQALSEEAAVDFDASQWTPRVPQQNPRHVRSSYAPHTPRPARPRPQAAASHQPAPAHHAPEAVSQPSGQPQPADQPQPAKQIQLAPKKKSIVGDVIFYAFLIALVVGAFFLSGGTGGGPKMIAGYSAFTVTTGSMHDVLPQGSLIITQQVDPEILQVGDDITYMISETSSITHRIVGIEQDQANAGQLAFKTQGTMNDNPDKNLVPAANVVGKVIFCSYELGMVVGFVQDNWPLLIFLTVVAAVLFAVLRRILR